MTKPTSLALAALLAAPAFAQSQKPDLAANPLAVKPAAPPAAAPAPAAPVTKGDYATFETSAGKIGVRFYADRAPNTVANFIGLATGTIASRDPRTGKRSKTPLYDGTVFHRVIKGFMIQGGDPTGTGAGSPGYTFADEVHPDDVFKPGHLAMANSGPNTNGSQFFITEVATTHLNGRHTIFGEVVCGFDLVGKIALAGNGATKLNHVAIGTKVPDCK
jgi:peptidyl-prolyl cis-trans isomerase A (cyclophilin A)